MAGNLCFELPTLTDSYIRLLVCFMITESLNRFFAAIFFIVTVAEYVNQLTVSTKVLRASFNLFFNFQLFLWFKELEYAIKSKCI